MKTPLSPAQLDQFKSTLENERLALSRSEKDTVHTDLDRVELRTPSPSNSDEHAAAELLPTAMALEEHVLESIGRIDLALARIQSNAYGVCIDCGQAIPLLRLSAFPAAARCLACKQTFETEH